MVKIAEGAGTDFDPGEMMDDKIKKVILNYIEK
jgi:hypothetical protein